MAAMVVGAQWSSQWAERNRCSTEHVADDRHDFVCDEEEEEKMAFLLCL